MINKKKLFIIFGLLILIIASFLVGLLVGQLENAKPDLLVRTNGQTFYATINEIKEYNGVTKIFVKGLEINDINYRGEFYFSVKDNIIMTWRGEIINISDLNIGNNISITFTDEMINTIYPTPLNEVIKIQLLDDEKY